MKAYIVIFPLKKQKYKKNLLPVVSDEIRYMKHNEIHIDTEWGLNYDYVPRDKSTRLKRIFINRNEENSELLGILSKFDINFYDFKHLNFFDSTLINSPIECYIEDKKIFPHLWE